MTAREAPVAVRRLINALDAVARAGAGLAAAMVASIFLLMLTEILVRNLLGRSLLFSWELSSYFLSATIFLGAANAARLDVHVRVRLVGELAPARVARLADLLWLTAAAAVVAFLLWSMAELTYETVRRGVLAHTPLRTPLGYSHVVNTLGVALLFLQVLARLIRALFGIPAEREQTAGTGDGQAL